MQTKVEKGKDSGFIKNVNIPIKHGDSETKNYLWQPAIYKKLSRVSYYIILPFIYLLSALPFPIMYLVSDLLYILLYRVIGYRRKVVYNNLRNSFPEKSHTELIHIMNRFYLHLCDMFLETFKTLTVSRASMLKRLKMTPQAEILFASYAEKNQSIILVLGHLGNWEWAGNTFSLLCRQKLYVIYHPLENKEFNGLISRIRMRFGTGLIAMKDTYKDMLSHRKEVTATAFIADQTPQPQNAYWMEFLHQDTPVFRGTELIAKKIGYPVVYVGIRKVRRGYYELNAETLIEEPKNTAEGEITEKHTKRLEQDIIAQPEAWLWSHRRWKHKRAVN